MKNRMKLETRGDRELVITRQFDAPRRMVWDAHTKPEFLKRWLCLEEVLADVEPEHWGATSTQPI